MGERIIAEQAATAEHEKGLSGLEEAMEMTEWFPDYLFGLTKEQGELPHLTSLRLKRHFGDMVSEGLELVRNEIPLLPEDMQSDIATYICGFPYDDLIALLDHDLTVVIRTLDKVFPPVRKKVRATSRPTAFREVAHTRQPVLDIPPAINDAQDEIPWSADALCAQTDPEMFFPEKGGSTRNAKKVCNSCEVRSECLEYALENDERFGIWGGLSERERRKLRKKTRSSPKSHNAGKDPEEKAS